MALSSSLIGKRVWFAVLMAVLLLPALQAKFEWIQLPGLGGYSELAPHPEASWTGLTDNTYQPALEKYLEDRIGFREVLVRLRNQWAYSLFNVGHANNAVVGADQTLLDGTAINAYEGRNYVGEDQVRLNVFRFKAVQDALAKQGKLLMFVLAPGKTSYYADRLPGVFQHARYNPTNYDAYRRELNSAGVNVLDLNALFVKWRDTASYPLFPRGGIHWSGYGINLAADTLFRYIERRGGYDLPDYVRTGGEVTDQPRDTDNDFARALNLFEEPKAYPMLYPRIEFQPLKPGQTKPNMLIIGDSFVWSILDFYPYIRNLAGDKSRFWYYYKEIGWCGPQYTMPADKSIYQLDRKAEFLASDVIVVLFTEHNLDRFDCSFSNEAFGLLAPLTPEQNARIQAIKEQLATMPEVTGRLWEKSRALDYDYDALMQDEALARFAAEQSAQR